MKVSELIDDLKNYNPDADVCYWDAILKRLPAPKLVEAKMKCNTDTKPVVVMCSSAHTHFEDTLSGKSKLSDEQTKELEKLFQQND